jgi:hypothetical protein
MSVSRDLVPVLASVLALSACAGQIGDPSDGVGATDGTLTFEEFLATVEREPFEGGVWIVDGDIPLESEKHLVEYYERLVDPNALTVARSSGRDQIWGPTDRRNITYCVSTAFGTRYSRVVADMASAAAAWEAVADVDFQHLSAEDARCTASNTNVVFDVRPVSGAGYLARAFFPYQSRGTRNVLIDSSSYSVAAPLTLLGILRHELGHVLGFRHEHTRTEAGSGCYEDSTWRAVTTYDRASVMHYPHCGGTNYDLRISALDASGAAALYGAPGSTSTPTPTPAPSTGTPRTGTAEGSLAADGEQRFEAIAVRAGSVFRVQMTGTGDADLYVRFGSASTLTTYDCRPYRADSNETCELTVPAGQSQAFLSVRGYTASTFRLDVSWTAP